MISLKQAYEMGKQAGLEGKGVDACPWGPRSKRVGLRKTKWIEGLDDGTILRAQREYEAEQAGVAK